MSSNKSMRVYAMETLTENQKLLQSIKEDLPQDVQTYIYKTIALLKMSDVLLAPTTIGYSSLIATHDNYMITQSWAEVKIWNIRDRQLLHRLIQRNIISVAINNHYAATRSKEGIIKVWNIHDGNALHTIETSAHQIAQLAISSDYVISNLDDKIAIWSINNGQQLHTLEKSVGSARVITTNDDIVIAGLYAGTIKVWNIHNGKLLHTLNGHRNDITSLEITHNKITAKSNHHAVTVWNLCNGELLNKFRTGKDITSIAADGDMMITVSQDKTSVWDMNNFPFQESTLAEHSKDAITSARTTDDTIITGSYYGDIKIWNRHNGQLLRTLINHDWHISFLKIVDDKVIGRSNHGDVTIWPLFLNLNDPKFNTKGTVLTNLVDNLAIPHADLIARIYTANQADQIFTIYDLSEDGKVFLTFDKDIRLCLLSNLKIKLEKKETSMCVIQ